VPCALTKIIHLRSECSKNTCNVDVLFTRFWL
jgi:hypothetical protein